MYSPYTLSMQELVELREDSGDKLGPSILLTAKQPSSKQQSLPGIIERSIAFPQDSAKHKRLVDATADSICQGFAALDSGKRKKLQAFTGDR